MSARQLELLEAIRAFAAGEGRMPSVREIASRLGRAPSTVQQHIDALCRKGLLQRDGSAHGLELVEPQAKGGEALVEVVEVPCKGRIAAGAPIEAVESNEESVTLPVSLAPEGTYALRVQGDSMVGDHILDGDMVIVREQPDVENGTIAVALLPDG
ncbi:MAG: transcriptional repressor LexA, partial [Myxococcota bacterium]